MKLRFLLPALLMLCASGYSQNATYSDIPSGSFEGIKTEDGKLFYTTYYGTAQPDTPYNYIIQVFNSELQRTAKERVPTKYNSEVVDIAEHNGGLLFYLQSGSEGLIHYYNAQGKKAWNKAMELDKGKYTDVKFVSLGADGFAIVRPDKEDKNGFRITLFDDQMNEKWVQGFYPDKGSIDYSQVRMSGDKIAVLGHYQRSIFSSKYEERLYVLSAKDGSLLYEKVIADQGTNGRPEDIAVNADGSSFVIGYIAENFKEGPSAMFYKGFGPSGSETFDKTFPLDGELAEKLSSNRAKRHFGMNAEKAPLVNIENIRKTADGYEILGETYKFVQDPAPTSTSGSATVSTTTPGTMHIMDYVVMNISNSGKLEVRRIGKPYKRIRAEGHTIGEDIFADDYFEKYDLFAYRFLTEKEGQPELLSMNWSRNTPYIGFTSLDVDHENILNRIYLPKSTSDRSSNGVSEYTFTKEGMQKPLETFRYNVLPYHQPRKMLYYDMDQGDLSMEVIDIKTEMPKPANGELQITGVPGREFQGLMPIEGKGYYTFYFSESTENDEDLYIYHRLDQDMNTTGRSVLVVPSSASFAGNTANADGQVMVFQDRAERAWYFYALDAQGKLSGQNRIALDATANQVPTGNLLLESAKDGFYMLQPYVDTAVEVSGYEVIRLNTDRQVRWNWSKEAKEGEGLQLVATDAGNGLFAVLHNQRQYNNRENVVNEISVIDDKSGKLLYNHNLFEGEDSGYPEYVKITADKSVVTSGMYLNGRLDRAKNSDGLFFLKLSGDGSRAFNSQIPWSEVEKALKVEGGSDFLVSGKTKVLIEDMIPLPNGSYQVIGELFKKSAGTTTVGFLLGDDLQDRAFSIYDFVVFDFDKTGKLSSVYRIPKDEQNIRLPGNTGHQRGLALSLMMRRYNMFSYVRTMQEEGRPQIIFTNTVDGKKKIYKAPVTKSANVSYAMAPAEYIIPQAEDKMNKLEMLNSKLDKLGSDLEEAVTGTDQTFTSFRDPYRGFAMAQPSEVLVYLYNPETRTLNLKIEGLK